MNKETLLSRLALNGIDIDSEAADRILIYHEMLLDWNTRMDLTAVTEESEMLDRHYVDSLSVLTHPELLAGVSSLIDVGTGAGLPGMLLALACPQIRCTLLDSQQKRLNFLQAVCDALHLNNVTLVHSRAEDGARTPAMREKFDLAIARAVAPSPVLAEYLLPYVRTGGKALLWKGPAAAEEADATRRAAYLLGGKTSEPVACPIAGRDWEHMLLPIIKIAPTPKAYPRKAGTPSKQPLGQKKEPKGING